MDNGIIIILYTNSISSNYANMTVSCTQIKWQRSL